jgi:hypothetical protein
LSPDAGFPKAANCRWNRCIASSFVAPMTEETHARYFADRESFERAMSDRARNWRVAAVHSEMAERYEALAKVFGAKR